jgi:hypothetical protein
MPLDSQGSRANASGGVNGQRALPAPPRVAPAPSAGNVDTDMSNDSDQRQAVRFTLFSKDFLHLADFLLDLPTDLFVLAFGF